MARLPSHRKWPPICSLGIVGILALFGAKAGLVMSVVYGLVAAIASFGVYGRDPRIDKDVDPDLARRAGIDTNTVIEALNEAEGKLARIEDNARELHNRELTERLSKIVSSGRRILDQIEKDPSDIRRARRFLVTYLDGTADVVSKFRRSKTTMPRPNWERTSAMSWKRWKPCSWNRKTF